MNLVKHPVLILGLAVLALATVVSRKPWLTPKRLIYRTHVLRLDDALVKQCWGSLLWWCQYERDQTPQLLKTPF
ncbi:hypothetical protein Pla52n_48300 [Stieleria varia]|uniref:Uncharacterized protein n=1 Tax=Stieleria varia TaxID=2528005 RepID=A0A5C6AG81_9BACT|nr:hypothetical protein Pla52n_48300 [Stieleria varia]